MGNKSIRTYWMHYKADMFVIKSDLKETPRLRRDLGDAAIDVFFNFLCNLLTLYGPMMALEFIACFYFVLRILAFRVILFQEDIPFAGNTGNCQNEFTGGTENHQHDSSTGDTDNSHDTSLANVVKTARMTLLLMV